MAKGSIVQWRAIDRTGGMLERARLHLEAFQFRTWRHVVACVLARWNARCLTCHVSEGEWLDHWRAGMDPVSAVLEELRE